MAISREAVFVIMSAARQKGCSWSVIALVLNKNHYFTPTGKLWSKENCVVFYKKYDEFMRAAEFGTAPPINKNSSAYRMVQGENV
jgi:hypothetical protein